MFAFGSAVEGGRKSDVPPSQDPAAPSTGGEAPQQTPLFGSRPGAITRTGREDTDGGPGGQGASIAMHSSVASVGDPIPDSVTEEQLMNSGHELHESYTCLLCCLPIGLPTVEHCSLMTCCMKQVCDGCIHASRLRGMGDMCPFCRAPTPHTNAAMLVQVRKRIDAKHPKAIEFLATAYRDGTFGLQQDIPRATELWTEAASLGDLNAQCRIGMAHYDGEYVEQDKEKATRHWQHAAIQGHPESRYTLGFLEYESGNHGMAVRHWMISAIMGHEESLNEIKDMFMRGLATKAQYADAMKGYQDALKETKSHHREEAKAFFDDEQK